MVYHPLRGLVNDALLAYPALTHGALCCHPRRGLSFYDYFFKEHQPVATDTKTVQIFPNNIPR
jgi:hypothetical protein